MPEIPKEPIMKWYLQAMRRYLTVSGRASRMEYWLFFGVYILLILAVGLLHQMIGRNLLGGLILLAHIVPSITVTVRRLHDIGRSGWWILVMLVPLIGPLIALYWTVQPSEPQTNAYGLAPHAAG
jgi:uncharacterized membrane protein YhaH (DUF805 family)